MNLIAYYISYYIGFFIVMIIAIALAIIFARSNAAWVLLGIGTVIQLLSLLGLGSAAPWGVFVVLLVAGIALILLRRSAPKKVDTGFTATDDYKPVDLDQGAPAPEGCWRCKCGRANANYVSSCVCGLSKRDNV